MRRLGPISLVFAVLAVAAAPSGALGQEDGVTLDPSDPAAKEYALPTEEARRETSKGTGAAVEHGANDSALFGEGVSRDADAKTSGDAKTPGSADNASGPNDSAMSQATTPAAGGAGGGGTRPPDEASLSGGPSSGLVLAGGGLLVLVAAGVGGLALRTLRSPEDV